MNLEAWDTNLLQKQWHLKKFKELKPQIKLEQESREPSALTVQQ